MALHCTKGHLMPYLLVSLLILLPSLVVSRIPTEQRRQRRLAVNEATMIAEKLQRQSDGGLIIEPALIARPEEQSAALDYKPRVRRSLQQPVAHQQSTNSAAAKRDQHYKQLRRARGAADPIRRRLIIRDRTFVNGRRPHNGLDSAGDFLPPKIVYAEMVQLPSPFVRRGQRERGRAFAMVNFLVKTSDESTSPRSSSALQKDPANFQGGEATEPSSSENLTDDSVLSPLMRKVINEAVNEEYAIFHRIVDDEARDDDDDSQSYDANSLANEAESNSRLEQYGSQSTQPFEEFKAESGPEEPESKYEFGYRVIDHGAGSDFGHEESHRVPGETNGRYHVLLPDGRVQRVEYYADDTGYHADISYARNDEPAQKH